MEERQSPKFGLSAKGLVALVFLCMALVFLPLAAVLGHSVHMDREERLVMLGVFGGIGAVFLIPGLILGALELRRRGRLREAWANGRRVTARIIASHPDPRVRVKGRSPALLECHWKDPDTGIVHVYFSRPLYFDAASLVKGAEVPLYLDRDDPAIGFVDVDAVLPEVRIHG